MVMQMQLSTVVVSHFLMCVSSNSFIPDFMKTVYEKTKAEKRQ